MINSSIWFKITGIPSSTHLSLTSALCGSKQHTARHMLGNFRMYEHGLAGGSPVPVFTLSNSCCHRAAAFIPSEWTHLDINMLKYSMLKVFRYIIVIPWDNVVTFITLWMISSLVKGLNCVKRMPSYCDGPRRGTCPRRTVVDKIKIQT